MTEIQNILTETDTQLLLFLNSWHCTWADNFMMLISSRFAWILFYASFLFVMFRNYPVLTVVKCLVAIAAIILLCDQTASGLIKPLAERMRPSNPDNPIAPMVNIVKGYRGGYTVFRRHTLPIHGGWLSSPCTWCAMPNSTPC